LETSAITALDCAEIFEQNAQEAWLLLC